MEKVVEETIQSPLLQAKWQKLVEEAGSGQKAEESSSGGDSGSSEEKKKEEETKK